VLPRLSQSSKKEVGVKGDLLVSFALRERSLSIATDYLVVEVPLTPA